jgi:beta-glucanase (GH16 family)
VVKRERLPPGTAWPFEYPFYVLLDVAVGGSYVGAPDVTTVFPQTMLVDYVRYYQQVK